MPLTSQYVLLALDRDAARRVFGCRQSGDWEHVVAELVEQYGQGGRRLGCLAELPAELRVRWESHELLRGLIAPAQPLWANDMVTLSLIRPDLVPLLVAAWDAEATGGTEVAGAADLRQVLQQAVEERGAVLAVIPSVR